MRLECKRDEIRIVPESDVDVAYLEDTLGLAAGLGSWIVSRVETRGLDSLAYARIPARRIVEKMS